MDAEDNIRLGVVQDFHTLDVTYTKDFKKKGTSISIGGKNLLNVQNIGVSGGASSGAAHSESSNFIAMGWGRSLFTSLKINLGEK